MRENESESATEAREMDPLLPDVMDKAPAGCLINQSAKKGSAPLLT
jgi:hypothetical protein